MTKLYAKTPRGKKFPLTDAMIKLRDNLAVGLGYVRRPCSFGPNSRTGETRDCWESEPLNYEINGRMAATYHCVTICNPDNNGDVEYLWPEQVGTAAFAIDKGKPLPRDEEV